MAKCINAISKKMSTAKFYFFITIQLLLIVAFSGRCLGNLEIIDDIRVLKQDHMFYIDRMSYQNELAGSSEHKLMNDYYNTRYFSTWHQRKPRYTVEEILKEFEKYGKAPGYGENKKKRNKSWIDKLKKNADLEDYPNMCYPAMTVKISNLRILPTNEPHFGSFNSAANGSQFDGFQVSSIGANIPVFISHISKDGAWLLADTDYYFGWIPAASVAYMDSPAMNAWESGQHIAITKDKTSVIDENNRFLFKVSLGAMFPKIGEENNKINILAAVADSRGNIRLKRAFIPKDCAVTKPMKLTIVNIASLANELINEPYSWGGLRGNRDCSLMIRDLFAPFGIWLHRNSKEQAQKGGTYIELDKYSSVEKRKKIMEEGIPYVTLIWQKGHIMLYIGNYQGEPLIFHNFWSVRTKNIYGIGKKKIIGHAAITTLLPGRGILGGNSTEDDLLENISGMTLLIPRVK